MNEISERTGTPIVNAGPGAVMNTMARGVATPQFGALVILASALTLGAGLIVWSLQPSYVPVSERASGESAAEIVDYLRQSAIVHRIDPNSGLVLVPRDQLGEIRMGLMANGLDAPRSIGLESLHDDPSLGSSQFNENARYQHGLETELSRTVSSLRNIESARVHLALPKQSVFVRDREQASASVMVKPKPGRGIEDEQVDAIINLVASSIPYLDSDQITVVDQWGRLLSSGDGSAGGATRDRFQYARKLETLYAGRIESLLAPIVGKGRIRASVTAEVDFSVNEETREIFDPDPVQLRSQETQTRVSQGGAAMGIPGALTNQPPPAAVAGAAADDNAEVEGVEANAPPVDESRTEIQNFELDKTITHVRQAPGGIRRLSAAVIIDDRVTVDADGQSAREALTDEEIAEYTALVREAIGFDEARGDTVVVFNRGFQPVEAIPALEPLPIWQQSWVPTLVRQALTGLAVLLLVLLVVRPAVRRLLTSTPAPTKTESAREALSAPSRSDEEGQTSSTTTAPAGMLAPPDEVYGDILNMARVMAANDPKRVAKVVKDWVKQ